MILLGIDPGTATTGYGVVDTTNPRKLVAIEYGKIETDKDHLMPVRLLKMYNSIIELIKRHKPDALVIERIFFNTNVNSAINVGQARGVYILAAGQHKMPVFEYTALEAKMALTGHGRSDKKVVRSMVTELLNIKTQIKPIDASDALAMALCHIIKTGHIGK
jgi:crossover junction endodeoxyribonuclease RuvC